MHRAWQARGSEWSRDTSEAEFEEMHRWLALVRKDVQLALHREPACGLCYALLIELSNPLSLRKEAALWFSDGMTLQPNSVAIPAAYLYLLDPAWGGSRAEQQAVVDRLRVNRQEVAAKRMQARLDAEQIAYWRFTDKSSAARGLEAARASLAIDTTYRGLFAAGSALRMLDRPAEAVEAFDRLLELYVSSAEALEGRGFALTKLGRWPEAVRDLLHAYEQYGSPRAFEWLVRLSRGNSEYGQRLNTDTAGELCREGAQRGLPIAMTCLGGMYWAGLYGVPRDATQAETWFRRAAEGGDPQGMMDLAQVMSKRTPTSAERAEMIRLWQSAAAKGHPQAQDRLDAELSFWERLRYVQVPAWTEKTRGWLHVALRLIELVFVR